MCILPPGGRKKKRIKFDDTLSILTLLIICLILFAPYFFGGKTIIPYDLLYSFSPWGSIQETVPQNKAMMDVVRQHIPWRIITKQALLSGEIPYWNPFVSSGMPFMANGLSQVLYPPNIILLSLFSIDIAYTLFLFVHLSFTSLGMYFLLRRLAHRCPAALVGGLAWMLSGYLIVWLPWPPNVATLAWLPWSFITLDWLLESGDIRAMGVVGLCLGMTILGGHLQYAYYSFLGIGFFVLFRILVSRNTLKYRMMKLSQVGLAVLLGIMLSCVLLFSMFELSQNDTRGEIPLEILKSGAIPTEHLSSLFVPNIYGDANSYTAYGSFSEFTGYIGIASLLLCMLTPLHPNLLRRKGLIFFLLFTGISLHLAYGGWLNNILALLPGFTQFRGLQRFLSLWSIGAAGLVAYGIEVIFLSNGWRRFVIILYSTILSIIGFLGFIFLEEIKDFMIQTVESIQWSDGQWQKLFMLIGITGVAIFSIVLLKREEKRWNDYLAWLMFIWVAVDLFSFSKGYLPEVDPLLKYPNTGGIKFLSSHREQGRITRFGEGGLESPLTPNVGIIYGLSDVDLYDSFSLERYNQFVGLIEAERYDHVSSYNALGNFQNPSSMVSPLFDLLGGRYLLSDDPILDPRAHQDICNTHSGELLAGDEIGQTFKMSHDGLYRVDISLATYARLNYGEILMELRQDSADGRVLVYQIVDVSSIPDNAYYIFSFPPIENSAGKEFYIGIVGLDGEPGNAITAWLSNEDVYPYGKSFINKTPSQGDLCFRAYSWHGHEYWVRAYSGDDMLIYENLKALPQAFFINEAKVAESISEQISFLEASSFQPQSEAVINRVPKRKIDPNSIGAIHTFNRTMNRIDMEVQVTCRDNGGALLVIQQNFYPGWRAWIDGEEVEILLTNLTFQGVVISNGFHHVEFVYRPSLLDLSLFISFLSVLVTIIIILFPTIKKRT